MYIYIIIYTLKLLCPLLSYITCHYVKVTMPLTFYITCRYIKVSWAVLPMLVWRQTLPALSPVLLLQKLKALLAEK